MKMIFNNLFLKILSGLLFLCSIIFSLKIFAIDNARGSTFEEDFIEHIRPQLENQIIENLSNKSQDSNSQVSWVRFKIPDAVAKMDSTLAKKIKLNPLKFEGKGVAVVQFEVTSIQYAFSVEYRVMSDVLVASRTLNLQEKITPTDLELKKLDVTFLIDRPVKIEEAVGRSLNRSISVGQILLLNDLKREPLVDRGQSVKIQMNINGLEISALGVAEQAGFLNDWIKVTNPDTKKNIIGQVIERGTVEIR